MTQVPDANGVIITLRDVYNLVVGLSAKVDASLSRADRTEATLAEHDSELRPLAGAADRLTDHEARLRTLERNRWPLQSLAILISLGSLGVAVALALTNR